ncbi:DnaT-like ssDNA-binding domain-containing protein [Litorivivens sp.]|uniref:DnaT-like ssDNA-binding domain-containing protein n=1 Tax=Litorivivens sp. TaxID=2020868 RepID=UPI00356135DB
MIERPLIVSPTLAATLGLHEAIVLQLLTEWAQLHGGEESWQLIDKAQLQQLLPFWEQAEIEKILLQLQSQGVLSLGSALNSNVRNIRFSLNAGQPGKSEPAPARTAEPAPPTRAAGFNSHDGGARPIDSDWRPDRESINYLTQFHGIEPAFIEALVPEFISHWREKGNARASWNSTFTQHVAKRWKKHQYDQQELAQTAPIAPDWQPSHDALEILERADIDRSFIEDAVPEFVLYWRESGHRDRRWNTRFIEHVRRQWAHYTNAIEFDTEPRQIPANWQPDEAVFDILRMANIDHDFARQLLPEFRLYWQDSRQLQRSWNSKFLQHVKYQWAQRHRMGDNNAGQQNADGKPQSEAEKLFHKLTDRSWASGLRGK